MINEMERHLDDDRTSYAAHNNLSVYYVKKGRFDDAIREARAAVEANPGKPEGYYNLGNAFYHKGEWREAIGHYEKVLEIDRYYSQALYNLGVIYLNSAGDAAKAVYYLEKYVQNSPETTKTAKVRHLVEALKKEQDKQ